MESQSQWGLKPQTFPLWASRVDFRFRSRSQQWESCEVSGQSLRRSEFQEKGNTAVLPETSALYIAINSLLHGSCQTGAAGSVIQAEEGMMSRKGIMPYGSNGQRASQLAPTMCQMLAETKKHRGSRKYDNLSQHLHVPSSSSPRSSLLNLMNTTRKNGSGVITQDLIRHLLLPQLTVTQSVKACVTVLLT